MEEEEEGNETTTTISEERKTVLMKLVNASRETQDKKSSNKSSNKKQKKSAYRLHAREVSLLDSPTRSEDVFRTLFSDKKNAFWLDSATADGSSGTNDSNGDNDTPRGRFSVMGCQGGPLWRRVEARMNGKLVVMNNQDEIVKSYHHGGNGSILEYMDEELKRFNVSEENFATCIVDEVNAVKDGESVKGLPEALLFACGFVGSLSYETREECDSPIFFANDSSSNSNTMVKAALYFVDQAVVVDHEKKMVYAMTLTEDGPETEDLFEALEWLATTTLDINRSLLNKVKHVADEMPKKTVVTQNCTQLAESIGFKWRDDKEEYMEKIKTSQERILDGHTYEVCLTNALTRRDVGAYKQTRHLYRELYYALRERNPAPYAAFFDFSNGAGEEKAHFSDMYVCCASPERFLRCDQNGNLEAKPIKGTIARVEPLGCAEDVKAARDLQTSVKDNAENLMIVDLLRNDLSLACEVGTVKVPGLLKIESYRTVHQLVSTVVGTLPSTSSGENHADGNADDNDKRISPIRAFQFAFPPGSMTGAPKYRTTQIIHELENEQPREMYSGSVGFWSCRNKAFDANVVIRSVTYKDGEMKIGAGGAITRLSDPLEEWGEVELKARRIVETVAEVERKLERERLKITLLTRSMYIV
jgi:para-aminobenzoate synthetase